MTLRRREALGLAIAIMLASRPAAVRAQATDAPPHWQPGDDPPVVEGIRLGDTREHVLAVLGAADSDALPADPDAAVQTLRYRGGALMILLGKSDGVLRIMLSRAEGGAIDGVRVGDRIGRLIARFGGPTSGTSTTGRYDMGGWMLTVRADLGDQKVLRLMLGSAASQRILAPPPAPPEPLPAWATAVPEAPVGPAKPTP